MIRKVLALLALVGPRVVVSAHGMSQIGSDVTILTDNDLYGKSFAKVLSEFNVILSRSNARYTQIISRHEQALLSFSPSLKPTIRLSKPVISSVKVFGLLILLAKHST